MTDTMKTTMEITNAVKERYAAQRLSGVRKEWPDDVRRALEYMNGHLFDYGFCIAQMRADCRIYENNFSMKFRHFTGESPLQYLQRHRISCSMAIMESREGGNTVTSIAYEVGYGNPSTFCMAFKRITGRTPLEFMKILNSNNNRCLKNQSSRCV